MLRNDLGSMSNTQRLIDSAIKSYYKGDKTKSKSLLQKVTAGQGIDLNASQIIQLCDLNAKLLDSNVAIKLQQNALAGSMVLFAVASMLAQCRLVDEAKEYCEWCLLNYAESDAEQIACIVELYTCSLLSPQEDFEYSMELIQNLDVGVVGDDRIQLLKERLQEVHTPQRKAQFLDTQKDVFIDEGNLTQDVSLGDNENLNSSSNVEAQQKVDTLINDQSPQELDEPQKPTTTPSTNVVENQRKASISGKTFKFMTSLLMSLQKQNELPVVLLTIAMIVALVFKFKGGRMINLKDALKDFISAGLNHI
ncbi:hypothetical protein MIR68_005382 [Amoeboaphelidium protococcarum]|nr:hypothetical protein MIR68_005382 [Amoeboaphelidium protococcarum]